MEQALEEQKSVVLEEMMAVLEAPTTRYFGIKFLKLSLIVAAIGGIAAGSTTLALEILPDEIAAPIIALGALIGTGVIANEVRNHYKKNRLPAHLQKIGSERFTLTETDSPQELGIEMATMPEIIIEQEMSKNIAEPPISPRSHEDFIKDLCSMTEHSKGPSSGESSEDEHESPPTSISISSPATTLPSHQYGRA